MRNFVGILSYQIMSVYCFLRISLVKLNKTFQIIHWGNAFTKRNEHLQLLHFVSHQHVTNSSTNTFVLGERRNIKKCIFYFSLTYLRVTCWCFWLVWFYGYFLLYCLKFKCNFLKLTKRVFYGVFLSSSVPIPVPHQHITLEEVLLVIMK